MNVKQSIAFLLFLSCSMASFSQAKEDERRPSSTKVEKKFNKFDPDNLIIGGSFGAQFGTITLVDLSPTIGYKLREDLLVGMGARYIYFQEQYTNSIYRTNVYGGGPFAQYFFLENFIAHIEYEFLNLEANTLTNVNALPNERVTIDSFFIGGGYRSVLGRNSYAGILLLYNVLDDINSPYTNPILRITLGFGL